MVEILGKQISIDGHLVRIGRLEGELYVSLSDPEALINEIRHSGVGIDLFTFMQMPPNTVPTFRFPLEWDNVAALEITTYENWWTKQIGFKARNKAKQAEKRGVTLREVPFDEVLVRGIWNIYNECPIRQGRRFPHYGKDLETIYRLTATFLERSVFIGAFFEEQLVGFTKVTASDSGLQAGLMNILSMVKHRDKAPTNALIAEAVKSCAKRGISYLLYSKFAYGKKQNDTLMEFKERNGFKRIDVPRYFVPVTKVGSAALRLGLNHNLTSRVPESVLTKLRDWRIALYKHRFNAVETT